MQADDLSAGTDVRPPAAAPGAPAADDDRVDEDPVSDAKVFDDRSDGTDDPSGFMPEGQWPRGGCYPVEDMEVGAAETTCCHLDETVVRPEARDLDVLEAQRRFPNVEASREH